MGPAPLLRRARIIRMAKKSASRISPMALTRRCISPVAFVTLLLSAGFVVPATSQARETLRHDVQSRRDVSYYTGPGADPLRHKLDLFLPKDVKDFPVVFFVHGGGWR